MDRQQLEHILRAAAAITGGDEFVVIGSQSILGTHPDAPAELRYSAEVDIFSPRSREEADLIDGSIGEASPFHDAFALRGPGTGGATGLCLEPHDLAISKLVAGREKDLAYVAAMVRHRLIDPSVLRSRLDLTTLDDALRAACVARLRRAVSPP